jgi:hypothetical protein
VQVRVAPTVLTVPRGATVALAWPGRLRPDDVPVEVGVEVAGIAVGRLPVERADDRRVAAGAASLGQALASGVYGALRAAEAAGRLG